MSGDFGCFGFSDAASDGCDELVPTVLTCFFSSFSFCSSTSSSSSGMYL